MKVRPARKLWRWLGIVFVLSFAALGWLGREIYLAAPPIPKAVVGADGSTVYTGEQIENGQRAWRSAGGQQLGTVWGHGSYVAPDWSADWLHREALALRGILAEENYGRSFDELSLVQRTDIDAAVKQEMRRNDYEAATGTLTVSRERARAIALVATH